MLSNQPFFRPSIRPSINFPSIRSLIDRPSIHLSIHWFIFPSVSPSIHVFVCLSTHPSIHLSIYPCTFCQDTCWVGVVGADVKLLQLHAKPRGIEGSFRVVVVVWFAVHCVSNRGKGTVTLPCHFGILQGQQSDFETFYGSAHYSLRQWITVKYESWTKPVKNELWTEPCTLFAFARAAFVWKSHGHARQLKLRKKNKVSTKHPQEGERQEVCMEGGKEKREKVMKRESGVGEGGRERGGGGGGRERENDTDNKL